MWNTERSSCGMVFDELEDKLSVCRDLVKKIDKICVISGAGIDTIAPTNICDFRSPESGLYNQSPEELLDIEFYKKNPEESLKFIKENLYVPHLEINPVHEFFVELEKKGKNITHITQNITGTLQQAGAKRVIEVHGNLRTGSCMLCGKKYSMEQVFENHICVCGGIIKPDMVFYGEGLATKARLGNIVFNTKLLIVVGTSLSTYPIQILPGYVNSGVKIININKTENWLANEPNVLSFEEDMQKVFSEL